VDRDSLALPSALLAGRRENFFLLHTYPPSGSCGPLPGLLFGLEGLLAAVPQPGTFFSAPGLIKGKDENLIGRDSFSSPLSTELSPHSTTRGARFHYSLEPLSGKEGRQHGSIAWNQYSGGLPRGIPPASLSTAK